MMGLEVMKGEISEGKSSWVVGQTAVPERGLECGVSIK